MTTSTWIECGILGTSLVSALRDGDRVRVSLRELSKPLVDESGVEHWPYAATPEEDIVADVVETALGCWIDLPCSDRWSDAGDREVVQSVDLFPVQPTHRIVFEPADGTRAHVEYVRLVEEAEGTGGPAYSHSEWVCETAADWECSGADEWYWQGKATPGGENGSVSVKRLG